MLRLFKEMQLNLCLLLQIRVYRVHRWVLVRVEVRLPLALQHDLILVPIWNLHFFVTLLRWAGFTLIQSFVKRTFVHAVDKSFAFGVLRQNYEQELVKLQFSDSWRTELWLVQQGVTLEQRVKVLILKFNFVVGVFFPQFQELLGEVTFGAKMLGPCDYQVSSKHIFIYLSLELLPARW